MRPHTVDVGGRLHLQAAPTRPVVLVILATLASVVVGVGVGAVRAGAVTLTRGAPVPIVTQRDARGSLAAVTISASGFTPGAMVAVEQCDGVAPSAPQWSPTVDCDLGTSPSKAIADATGTATFRAGDHNHAFVAVDGASPSSLFNCLAAHEPAPANGLTSFTNCQVRVSTNNSAVTGDQLFAPLVLAAPGTRPAPATIPPRGGRPAATKARVQAQARTTATAHGATKRNPVADTSAKTLAVTDCAGACASAAGHHGAGLVALNDPGVASGWALVVVGLGAVCASLVNRRRRPVHV